jgi:Ran GTPase-activating protein (RanGAP) involved in mRNA processing and transport
MKNMVEIYLGHNAMGDRGAQAFARALPFMPRLQEIDLSNNNIGDEGELPNGIDDPLDRTSWRVHIVPPGALVWGAALGNGPGGEALQVLDLRSNVIADVGASVFRDMLTSRTGSLEWLMLDGNKRIRQAGRAALREVESRHGIKCFYLE